MFVSIVVPNYNHSKFLSQRIDSILSQTYRNFELIILDDCSNDNSVEVINRYAKHEKVSHVVINEQNSGSTFIQWQKGFSLAKGEMIWIAESDDYCDPDFLQTMVNCFFENKKLAFAYCTSTLVDANSKPLSRKDFAEKIPEKVFEGVKFIKKYMLSHNSVWNASAVVFRKEFALCADNQFMNFKAAGDHLFWIELAEMGQVAHISKKMNYFRQHGNKVTPTKTKDGTTYTEEHQIFTYVTNKYELSPYRVLKARCSFVRFILKGDFLSDDIREKLLHLWGYKKWMTPVLLRIIIRLF